VTSTQPDFEVPDFTADLEHFDHRGPMCLADDPRPFLRTLRERCPVGHTDAHGGYHFLTTYADVCAAERRPEVYSSASGVAVPPHGMAMMPPIEYDPPMQAAFRSPLISRFSPKGVARFEPAIRRTVHALIDEFIERGEADLAAELALPLPAIVVSPVLGVPDADREMVQEWAKRIGAGGEGFDVEAGMAAVAYFAELYQRRKAQPADDLTTLVMNLDVLGRPITMDEFLPMMVLLMTAGLDTTTSAAAYALLHLARHPEQRAALIDDPTLIPGAVEELLRVYPPIPVQARTMLAPDTVHGVDIPAGDRVQLVYMTANFDPAEFDDPDVVDFERQPNRHLTFGLGVHRCLGSHLARLELRVLLEVVLERMPDFRVELADVVRYAGVIRGITRLPVTFTPGPRVG
jgi:cytochrome P450